jgi:hypothetical protein
MIIESSKDCIIEESRVEIDFKPHSQDVLDGFLIGFRLDKSTSSCVDYSEDFIYDACTDKFVLTHEDIDKYTYMDHDPTDIPRPLVLSFRVRSRQPLMFYYNYSASISVRINQKIYTCQLLDVRIDTVREYSITTKNTFITNTN